MIIPNFHPSTIPMIAPVFSPHVAWTPLFLSKPRRTSKADSNSTFLVVDVSSETVEEGVEGVGIGFWMVARRLSGPCWKIWMAMAKFFKAASSVRWGWKWMEMVCILDDIDDFK